MRDGTVPVQDLLAKSGRRLYGILFRLVLRADIAEELLQDLVVRLLNSRSFVHARSGEAFAVRSAVRIGIDWRRRQKRRPRCHDFQNRFADIVDPAADPTRRMQDAEEWDRVLAAVCQLPSTQRIILILHYLEGQPYEEIAAQLGTTEHRVRALCYKGIVRVRLLVNENVLPPTEICDVETEGH